MKILVVDDERDVKILFQQQFRKEIRNGELQFAFAYSGEEAVRITEVMAQEELFILSDINMPGMNGLELLKTIKKKFVKPSPVMMIISAYGDEENRNRAKNLGADDFLTKPVDFTLLKTKLKELT
ncbi:response regulator [Pricia sp.]|uniref:response regulator n=1 Tax=Pricia sp. TaxID=2268138 RepID=UPI0035934CF1